MRGARTSLFPLVSRVPVALGDTHGRGCTAISARRLIAQSDACLAEQAPYVDGQSLIAIDLMRDSIDQGDISVCLFPVRSPLNAIPECLAGPVPLHRA
jgi:hypothetical protein